jgi:hypothetical protein
MDESGSGKKDGGLARGRDEMGFEDESLLIGGRVPAKQAPPGPAAEE